MVLAAQMVVDAITGGNRILCAAHGLASMDADPRSTAWFPSSTEQQRLLRDVPHVQGLGRIFRTDFNTAAASRRFIEERADVAAGAEDRENVAHDDRAGRGG